MRKRRSNTKEKFEKSVILLMVGVLLVLLLSLVPNKEQREERRTVQKREKEIIEQKEQEDEEIKEMENVELTKRLLEIRQEKASRMVESLNENVELVLLEESGSHRITSNKDVGKTKFGKWLTHSEMSVKTMYKAFYSIGVCELHTECIDGDVYVNYSPDSIGVKSVEITEAIPIEDKTWLGRGYTKEEVLALVKISKEQITSQLEEDMNNRDKCEEILNNFLVSLAEKFGVNRVLVNEHEFATEASYEFIKKPNLTMNNPGKLLTGVDYIVVHSTAVKDKDAEDIYNNFNSIEDRKASSQFVVDDKSVIQCLDTNMVAWAIGTGSDELGCYNSNSLSVEICEYNNPERQQKAVENAEEFIKNVLCKEFPNAKVIKHRDVSATECPSILSDEEFSERFK